LWFRSFSNSRIDGFKNGDKTMKPIEFSVMSNTHQNAKTKHPNIAFYAMDKQSIPQLLGLQQTVYDALDEDKKRFILPKSKGYLTSHFENGSTAIGISIDGKHIAQALIAMPSEANPNTCLIDFDLQHPLEELSVIQGLLVHPDFRGLKLGQLMIEVWIKIAEEAQKKYCMAETETRNHYSWRLFLDADVPIISTGHDAEDGADLFHHCHEIGAHVPEPKISHEIDSQDFPAIASLSQKGFIGTDYVKTTSGSGISLTFSK
jgi:ribosomal protein S18 acetylase RimI-like enzyme